MKTQFHAPVKHHVKSYVLRRQWKEVPLEKVEEL
jgi:hypothetical protein